MSCVSGSHHFRSDMRACKTRLIHIISAKFALVIANVSPTFTAKPGNSLTPPQGNYNISSIVLCKTSRRRRNHLIWMALWRALASKAEAVWRRWVMASSGFWRELSRWSLHTICYLVGRLVVSHVSQVGQAAHKRR